jgi:hypothetical protein
VNKRLISFLVCLALAVLQRISPTLGSPLSEVPDFADQDQWVFVEERPLVLPGLAILGYEIGSVKKYRHTTRNLLVGFEEFIVGEERSFWKRWGLEDSSLMHHALRKKDSEQWTIGPPGSQWRAITVYEGIALKGIWFFLFIPSEREAFGRYFPIPISRFKPIEPPKKGEST